jgi:Tol biopolymer transport system component
LSLAALLLAAALAAAVLTALLWQPEPAEAAFPGKNGRIAFVSSRGGSTNIYTMGFASKNVKPLTSGDLGGSSPAFSPDGKKIAYVGFDYTGKRRDIYVMGADGSNKRLITDERKIPGDALNDFDPAFSPSGRQIVFSRGRGFSEFNNDLYKINVDGTNLRPVFETKRTADQPSWSPDGTKIAFHFSGNRIATVSPNGGNFVSLGHGSSPDWSPDGTQLTFQLDEGRGASLEIYKMKEDGSGVTQLTSPDRTQDRYPGAHSPAFSPGGGKILYGDGRDGDQEIYMMNADGTNDIKLTNNKASGTNAASDTEAVWQPAR